MKNRKHTEDAAADRAKNGDIPFTRVDVGPTSLNSFGMIAELLLMAPKKCIGDAVVNKGTEAPKPHLLPVEVRMLSSAAGGLTPAGTTFISTRVIFPPPPPFWSLGEKTKKRTGRTNFNQLVTPLCRRHVIKTK